MGKNEDFERAFEEQYVEPIYMAKTNKGLKEKLEATTKENYDLKGELRSKDEELTQSRAKVPSSNNFL